MRRSAENVTKAYFVNVMCDFMRSPVSDRVISTSMTIVLALSFITESPVPPMVWNGFKGIGDRLAVVANCTNLPHQADEIERRDPFTKEIPYDWALKHG